MILMKIINPLKSPSAIEKHQFFLQKFISIPTLSLPSKQKKRSKDNLLPLTTHALLLQLHMHAVYNISHPTTQYVRCSNTKRPFYIERAFLQEHAIYNKYNIIPRVARTARALHSLKSRPTGQLGPCIIKNRRSTFFFFVYDKILISTLEFTRGFLRCDMTRDKRVQVFVSR